MAASILFQPLEHSFTADPADFEPVFNMYAPCLYGIIFTAVNGTSAIAEKLTGQTFVSIYRNRKLYNPDTQRLLVWMIAMAASVLKEHGYDIQAGLQIKTSATV